MKQMGGVLFAVGILLMGTSGLCSLSYLPDLIHSSSLSFDLFFIAIFGGVPFIVGIMLLFFGRALMRSADTKEKQDR